MLTQKLTLLSSKQGGMHDAVLEDFAQGLCRLSKGYSNASS